MSGVGKNQQVSVELKVEPPAVGYIVPGIVFMLIGFWWALNVMWLYSKSYFRPQYYQSRHSFNCQICATEKCNVSKFSIEGLVKILVSIFGIVYEIVISVIDGELVVVGNIQYAAVYSVFGLAGLVDILNSRCCNVGRCLPRYTDYALMCLAFLLEGVTLQGHYLLSETYYDAFMYLHSLLMYVSFGCAVSFALEAVYNHVPMVALIRCFMVTLHGTWLITVGLIVYSNVLIESETAPEATVWSGVYFAFNVIVLLIVLMMLAMFVHFCNTDKIVPVNTRAFGHTRIDSHQIESQFTRTNSQSSLAANRPVSSIAEHD